MRLIPAILLGVIFCRLAVGGDFSGDGADDIAVFRPATGLWAIRALTRVYFGRPNDIPTPGRVNSNTQATGAVAGSVSAPGIDISGDVYVVAVRAADRARIRNMEIEARPYLSRYAAARTEQYSGMTEYSFISYPDRGEFALAKEDLVKKILEVPYADFTSLTFGEVFQLGRTVRLGDRLMRDVEKALAALGRSKFRSRISLEEKDLEYLRARGLETVLDHAGKFIEDRLAPAHPRHDGRQTPWRNHPVFTAQHATATCCRNCLWKWHGIEKGRGLTGEEKRYILEVIGGWLARYS